MTMRDDTANVIMDGSAENYRRLIDAMSEIERLRALMEDACKAFDHYDLPEHAFHYRRILASETNPAAVSNA